MSDLLIRSDPQFAPLIARAHTRRRRYVRRVTRLIFRRLARLSARAWRTWNERRERRRLVDELLRRRRLANDAALAVHAGKLRLSDLAWMRVPIHIGPVARWPRNDNLLAPASRPIRSSSR